MPDLGSIARLNRNNPIVLRDAASGPGRKRLASQNGVRRRGLAWRLADGLNGRQIAALTAEALGEAPLKQVAGGPISHHGRTVQDDHGDAVSGHKDRDAESQAEDNPTEYPDH